MSGSICTTIALGNYLCDAGPSLTGNFYEENKLYNVVSASPLKSMGGTPTWVTRVAWVSCLPGCVGQTFLVWVKILGVGQMMFGVGQIFFGMHQFFFGIVQNVLGVGQNFFVLV